MTKIFKTNNKVGTVGARLHFGDNTIQHDGVLFFFDKNKNLRITHQSIGNYFNYSIDTKEVIGNTAALLMIKRKTFEICGGFNESYTECFEDVELNLRCILNGFKNYCDGLSVAYHFESQTRKYKENKSKNEYDDLKNNLLPFVTEKIKFFKKYIYEL